MLILPQFQHFTARSPPLGSSILFHFGNSFLIFAACIRRFLISGRSGINLSSKGVSSFLSFISIGSSCVFLDDFSILNPAFSIILFSVYISLKFLTLLLVLFFDCVFFDFF